jgi:hypothetical protein
VSYATPLETRLAKKVTRAIVEYGLIEDGDRVMVGLSGGKDSGRCFRFGYPQTRTDSVFARGGQRELGIRTSGTIW